VSNRAKNGVALHPVDVTTEEHTVNDRVVAQLKRVPGLYVRNHQLVEVLCAGDGLDVGPVIRPLTLPRTRELISTVVEFQQGEGKRKHAVHPPDWAVKAVHGRGTWPGVPPIVGLLEAPALRADGSVIQDRGYDSATGFVMIPGVAFPRVPDAPTQADARTALAALLEVFQDFPHASPADRCATVAALLTLLARPAIRGAVPAFVIRATTAGSGKGLQADVVGTIALGRAPAKMSFAQKEEEREKVLGSYALRGASLICFDNLGCGFGGPALDRCLTAIDSVELRILGRSEIPELKWRAVIIATGNNPEYLGDTPRRVLQSTLEPREENPEERDATRYQHHPLLAWVSAERARLVVAALTLLRAHALAGRPQEKCRTWGSFESWAAIVPPAIVWAGGADPMLTRPVLDTTADAGKQAAAELLRCWAALDPQGRGMTAADVIRDLYPGDRREWNESPLHVEARSAVEGVCRTRGGRPPDATALGYALRKLKRRTIGERRLDQDPRTGDGRRWLVQSVRVDGADSADLYATPRGSLAEVNGAESSPASLTSLAAGGHEGPRHAHSDDAPEQGALLFVSPEAPS
jgi:hypothetical protein